MAEKIRFSAPIQVEEAKKSEDGEGLDKLVVSGTAVAEGTSRNDVHYTAEVLEKSAETLKGKPLLLDHSESTRDIVGKVTEAEYTNGKVPFKAEVDTGEQDLVRKLENGFVDSVSIGAGFDEEASEHRDGVLHVKGLEMYELSFVPVPGVPEAALSQVIAEKFKTHQQGEKMSEEKNQEEVEELKEQIDELQKERDSLQDQLLEKEENKEEVNEEIVSVRKEIEELKEELEEEEEVEEDKGEVDPEEKEEEDSDELLKESSDKGTVRFFRKNPLGV